MKLPLRAAAISAQCETIINIENLVSLTIPPICDAGDIPADWFNTDFKRRIKITINANQVLPLSGSQPEYDFLFNSIIPDFVGNTQDNGEDFRFALPSKIQLAHEIQGFNKDTGELQAWAKFTTTDPITDDLFFYLYYDNPDASDDQNLVDLWIDYFLVMHLNEDTSITTLIKNSADQTKNGLAFGTPPLAAGQIGQNIKFEGSPDEVTGGYDINESFTATIWVKSTPALWNQFGWILAARGPNGVLMHPVQGGLGVQMFIPTSGAVLTFIGTVTPGNIQIFHRYGMKYNADGLGTRSTILDNIITDTVGLITRDTNDFLDPVKIGKDDQSGRYGDGVEGEARISKLVLTDDFLNTEYNNQFAPETFYGTSPPETISLTQFLLDNDFDFLLDDDDEFLVFEASA